MTTREIFDTMDYGPAPESDAEARAWIAMRGPVFGHFIDGRVHRARGDLHTKNPAAAKRWLEVTQGSTEDVDAAVKAATRAFPKWSKLSGHERAKYLYALARLLQKHARLFAVLESLDNGKPIREARDIDVPWHSGISTTTQASPNFLQKNSRGHAPSASAARSSRGTSRS
jgi:aldehyde dehydrogenase (NAD+)